MGRKVSVTLSGDSADPTIERIGFETNRMAFTAATKRLLNQQNPEMANGDLNVQAGIDRRHWESNEVIKANIRRQFEGQPFYVVAEHLHQSFQDRTDFYDYSGKNPVPTVPTTTAALEQALSHRWRLEFSKADNLRLGPSEPNQSLGRLVGQLKPRMERMYAGEFEPFAVPFKDHDGQEITIRVDTPSELHNLYWNANYDFVFDGDAEMEIEEAERLYGFSYPAPEDNMHVDVEGADHVEIAAAAPPKLG